MTHLIQDVETVSVPDGFVPSSLPDRRTTRIVVSKREPFLKVIKNAISAELCERMYEYTVRQKQPWGEYVTLKEVRNDEEDEVSLPKRFAKQIVKSLYFENMEANRVLQRDISKTHGFAMWCLASTKNKEVTYHLGT